MVLALAARKDCDAASEADSKLACGNATERASTPAPSAFTALAAIASEPANESDRTGRPAASSAEAAKKSSARDTDMPRALAIIAAAAPD